MANMNLCKITCEHFSQALTDFEISTIQIRDRQNVGQGHDEIVRSGALRRQITDFLTDSNSNVCSVSYRFRGIDKLRKIPNFDLEDECHCRGIGKREFSQSTRIVRIHTEDFLEF